MLNGVKSAYAACQDTSGTKTTGVDCLCGNLPIKAGKICYHTEWPNKAIQQCAVSTTGAVSAKCACCSVSGVCMVANSGDTCAVDGTAVPLAVCEASDGTKAAAVPCLCGTATISVGEVCYDGVTPNAPINVCSGNGLQATSKCVSF